MTTNTSAPRRRRRTGAAAEIPTGADANAQLAQLWAYKVASDEAKALYDKKRKEFQTLLQNDSKTEHTIPADGDRPAVTAKLMSRVTSTIDTKAFKKKVTALEFLGAVSVTQANAKKLLSENDLDAITTKSTGATSLDVRGKGAKRG